MPRPGWPPSVFAALPDGSYWTGAWGMTSRMEGASLLFNAAASVSGTLDEVHEIEWPVCVVHGSDPVTGHLYGEDRVEIADGTVVWWCPGAGHAVAPVGQLTAEVARML